MTNPTAPQGERPEYLMNKHERLTSSPDPHDNVQAQRMEEFRLWCQAVPPVVAEDLTEGGLFP